MHIPESISAIIISKMIPKIIEKSGEVVEVWFSDKTRQYLVKMAEAYSTLKPFLSGGYPIDFEKVYYPLSIEFPYRHNNNSTYHLIDKCSIDKIFIKSSKIAILGSAGSGKSCLLHHLFLDCIKQNYSLPIYIELRNIDNKKIDISDYIFGQILNFDLSKRDNVIKKYLNKGLFTFIFDGYDEIHSEYKNQITAQLKEFTINNNANNFIIASRPYTGIEQLQGFYNYTVKNLNHEDIKPFVIS